MVTVELDPLSCWAFEPHPVHATERDWTETNCYVDVWIEVLHALGLDPLAGTAFTLSADFEGDQWRFFKFPPEDLRSIYGIEVLELNVWRPLVDHVVEQLGMGRLCTVEVDSFYLPDTYGVAYRQDHVKTTIVPHLVDPGRQVLRYFHNAGYFELGGDDFDGVLSTGAHSAGVALSPYVEVVRLDRLRRLDTGQLARVTALAAEHLGRRPPDNPVSRLASRLADDLGWLAEQELETFHRYSFGTCRQCGATAELAASFVDWLQRNDRSDLEPAVAALRRVSSGAKALQFALARVVRGRSIDLAAVIGPMEENWSLAIDHLVERYVG